MTWGIFFNISTCVGFGVGLYASQDIASSGLSTLVSSKDRLKCTRANFWNPPVKSVINDCWCHMHRAEEAGTLPFFSALAGNRDSHFVLNWPGLAIFEHQAINWRRQRKKQKFFFLLGEFLCLWTLLRDWEIGNFVIWFHGAKPAVSCGTWNCYFVFQWKTNFMNYKHFMGYYNYILPFYFPFPSFASPTCTYPQ